MNYIRFDFLVSNLFLLSSGCSICVYMQSGEGGRSKRVYEYIYVPVTQLVQRSG